MRGARVILCLAGNSFDDHSTIGDKTLSLYTGTEADDMPTIHRKTSRKGP